MEVGNGRNTRFWTDNWSPFGRLNLFLNLRSSTLGTRPNSMISDLCNDGVWSLPLPRSEDQLALHAYLTTVTLTDSEDTVSLSSPKHLRLLSLLAWQAAIYTLWTERNSRIHKNEFRSTSTIALIKNRISSFRYSSPALSSAMMQIWLHD
ncbi:hypothetical protein DY000_02061920 [Brassica cretica]|uniref:Reverse transcriptase zinc-binding domain-containing protein n=1 Tax=Brassica cretica TaxID=69181 RepID=A0ABQ7AX20_BRACR|nr:hypothetical protein DY000_02061920 [Brassica cretica]